jgi:hypothetical protein
MTKAKLSVTIDRDVLEAVDRELERSSGTTRSSVIERWLRLGERWLRLGARASAEQELHLQTVAYYEALSRQERLEDQEWATFSTEELASVAEASVDPYGEDDGTPRSVPLITTSQRTRAEVVGPGDQLGQLARWVPRVRQAKPGEGGRDDVSR